MKRFIPRLVMLLGLAPIATVSVSAASQPSSLCFNVPAITNCIDGRFREFWEQNGGLPAFGYPVSAAQPEVNHDNGTSYLTQYFERQRFELHPEQPRPYDVLLGRLGDDQLRQHGVDWHTLPTAQADAPHFFAATGHAIAPQVWDYWRSHGLELGDPGISERESLALFGLPISEPRVETNSSGDTVLTQHFERASLEIHAEQPDSHRVLQGRLGSEVSEAEHGGAHHETQTAGPGETKTAEPRETETVQPRETQTIEPQETHTAEPSETQTVEPQETHTAEPLNREPQKPTASRTKPKPPSRTKPKPPSRTKPKPPAARNGDRRLTRRPYSRAYPHPPLELSRAQ